jgi:inner membrane protein
LRRDAIMDLFTHALMPYLLGKSARLKKEDVTAFILGGIAPDIDVFILWVNSVYPTFFLLTHRGITHSLFFGFFTGILMLYLPSRDRIKKIIRRFIDFKPVFTRRTVFFSYAGVMLHLFLDYITTLGIPLFYPLTPSRLSAEVFFYTDIYLTILSLLIIIYLYKKPHHTNNSAKFLIIFLLVFAGLGAIRITEKKITENFFQSTNLRVFPTMSPFDWYVMEEDANSVKIYEYNAFDRIMKYRQTNLKLSILSKGENLYSAIAISGELPQVKMFRWRAYTVALNASLSNTTWYLEYYDPLQNAMMRDTPSPFRGFARGFGYLNVAVEGGKATVI